jgi:EAL domain-containing protein (putative c-di-GMP-specific phosphodiesterase class I)
VLAGHRHVTIGASIGIVIADDCDREDEQRAVALLRDADTALQVAKRAGTGHVVTFDDSLRNQAMSRLDTEQDLRMALADDQLVLHFQPITSLAAGASPYSEALVRWHHPGKGILQPGQFLPVAEESGLMVPLGRRILALACRQLAIWRRSEPSTRLAVNVAAEHLAAGTLVDDVLNVLRRHDLPASALTIEVTEQTLLAGQGSAAADLARLRAAGARIAIDDFGTGYSSLAYLRDLPVDVLKIDRTFVAGLGTEANDGALFAAIIAISQSLGLDTVAEGIETPAELEAAVSAGATYLQGFLLGRPRPPR